MRRITFLFLCVLSFSIKAQTVTWSNPVAGIVYSKCATCHHQGGIGPFELMSYSDAVASAAAMANAVYVEGTMPPWPPDTSYRKFAHQRTLTVQEKNDIMTWIGSGLPSGDLATAPAPPVFPVGSGVSATPDLVSQMPTYTITASADIYQAFVVPAGTNIAHYIKGFEVIPGNRTAVHHVLVFADTTGVCAALDSASPGPGYLSFGGTGSSSSQLIGAYVPGAGAQFFPNGMGLRLAANADIVIQIHYPGGVAGLVDSTKVNFFFSTASSIRPLYISPILNHSTSLTNGPLFIAANSTKTFYGQYVIPAAYGPLSLISIAPHMHLIGRNMTSYSVSPANDTVPFIRINNWDFKWQGAYDFQKVQKVETGSTLYFNAFYDNTASNPYNPFTPPVNITAGEATTNEMMMIYFTFTTYQAGDENIIIDSTLLNPTSLNTFTNNDDFAIWPNPNVTSILNIQSKQLQNKKVQITLRDITGKLIEEREIFISSAPYQFTLHDIANGLYILNVKTNNYNRTKKLSITK